MSHFDRVRKLNQIDQDGHVPTPLHIVHNVISKTQKRACSFLPTLPAMRRYCRSSAHLGGILAKFCCYRKSEAIL